MSRSASDATVGRERAEAGTAPSPKPDRPTRRMRADLQSVATMLERIGHPVVITETDDRVCWINQAFTRLTGFELGDVLGANVFELLVAPECDPAAAADVAECMARGQGYRVEIAGRRKDGERIWIDIDSQPFVDDDRGLAGHIAFCVDITERRRAEAELRAQKERYRDLADAASDWFWESDAEHRIVESIFPPDFPVSEERILSRFRWDIASDTHDHEKWAAHRAMLEARRPFREFRYDVEDDEGRLHIVSTSGKPVFSADGRFLGYRGMARDVTEEVCTVRNMERLAHALQVIDEYVFLFDRDDRAVFVNDHPVFAPAGLDPATVNGMHAQDMFDHLDRAMYETGLISSRGEYRRMRLERFRNPGEPFEVSSLGGHTLQIQDYRLADGGTISMARDITEQKVREQAMERLVRALDAIDERVFLYDRDDRVIFLNDPPKFAKFGIGSATALGMHVSELFDYVDKVMCEQGVISSRGSFARERLARFRNPGPPFEIPFVDGVTLRVQDYRLPDGGTLCLVSDVTERKAREQALLEARQVAEAASRAQSNFLARVSHELRTPLNAIIGFADLMVAQGGHLQAARVAECADCIATAGRHLHGLVEEVLEYSSVERGDVDFEPRPITVRSVLATALKRFRGWVRDEGLAVVCLVARDLPMIRADPAAVARILDILVREASKRFGRDRGIRLRGYQDGRRVAVEVSALGPGVAVAEEERAFEPFAAFNDSVVSDDLGVGLALATARALVMLQNGFIRCTVNVEGARSYVVAFPCSEAES